MNWKVHASERDLPDLFEGITPARVRIDGLTRCYCFSSSSSKSDQKSTSVSGRSATGKAATAGDFSTVQTGGATNSGAGTALNLEGSTVTVTGLQGSELKSLVGTLTKASSDQISQVIESGSQTVSTLGQLLAAEKDAQAGSPKTIGYVAIAGVAAFALIFIFSKK